MKQIQFTDAYGKLHILDLHDAQVVDLYDSLNTVVTDGNLNLASVKDSKDELVLSDFYQKEAELEADAGTLFNQVEWVNIDHPNGFDTFNYNIRVDINTVLTEEEVCTVSGAIGYACKVSFRGESLSLPEVTLIKHNTTTALCFSYDLTKSRSDDVGAHFNTWAENIKEFIQVGSPKYKTNKSGKIGERLIYGIGKVGIEIYTD